MRTEKVFLDNLPSTMLYLGRVGEKEHTQVVINCSYFFEDYPSATATMVVKPPVGDLYPVSLTKAGKTLLWNVSDGDLAYEGSGEFQITFTSGTEVIKTAYGKYSVDPSLVATGDPPDPIEDWIESADEKLDEFVNMTASANTLDAGASATATLTTADGHKVLTLGIPKGAKGDTGDGGLTAPAYADATANLPGEYVTYDGNLYLLPNGHEANTTWANTVKSQVTACEEVRRNKTAIEDITGVRDLEFIKGQYYGCNTVGNVITTVSNAGYCCAIGECTKDDIVTLNIYGGSTARAWAFLDKDYKVLACSASGLIINGEVIEKAPYGTAYIVVNNRLGTTNVYRPVGYYCRIGRQPAEYDYSKGNAINETVSSSAMATFSDGADLVPMKVEVAVNLVQEGSGDPSPTNVRAITGWTKAKVFRSGKNLFDVSSYPLTNGKSISGADGTEKTTSGSNYDRTESFIPFAGLDGSKITLNKRPSGSLAGIAFYSSASTSGFVGGVQNSGGTAGTPITAEVPAGTKYMRFCVPAGSTEVQIEIGENSTDYVPFKGFSTLEVSFPSSAGTVYGGTLVIDRDGSGKLTVDKGYTTVNDNSWTYDSTYTRFSTTISDIYKPGNARRTPFTCSVFTSVDNGVSLADVPNNGIYGAGSTTTVYIKCTDYTTEEAFKEAYGEQSIVYPLATSVEYAFTAGQIRSLFGLNNVWADTGNVAVTYSADTKTYIDNKFAQLQALILEN